MLGNAKKSNRQSLFGRINQRQKVKEEVYGIIRIIN